MENNMEYERWKQDNAVNLERYKIELQAYYEKKNIVHQEMIKGSLSFSYGFVKSVILINSGAIAIILAFLGKIWNTSVNNHIIIEMIKSIKMYSYGLVAGVLVFGLSYFLQEFVLAEEKRVGALFFFLAILLSAISIGTFIYGSLTACRALLQ